MTAPNQEFWTSGNRNVTVEANEGWLGERAEWRQGARLASAPPGNHKRPARGGDHGPANRWYRLKRTGIVWPALWCLKISIPLGNLSCSGCQGGGEKGIWWCKVTLAGWEDAFTAGYCLHVKSNNWVSYTYIAKIPQEWKLLKYYGNYPLLL